MSTQTLSVLNSKRNHVRLVSQRGQHLVIKEHSDGAGSAHAEYLILHRLHGLNLSVPRPVRVFGRFLWLPYIRGENLCDLVTRCPQDVHATALAEWFTQLHRSTGHREGSVQVHGDSILRNFLWRQDESLIGLDFESSQLGNPWDDVAEITASLLSTDPLFSREKQRLAQQFIHRYATLNPHLDLTDVVPRIRKSLEATRQRRSADAARRLEPFLRTWDVDQVMGWLTPEATPGAPPK